MIINIMGQKRHGKGTVATMLKEMIPEYTGTPSYAWADELKDIICRVFGMDRNELEALKNSENRPPGWNVTARQACQMVGQLMRDIKSDAWIDYLLRGAKKTKYMIIEDGRHANEASAVKSVGGINLFVVDPRKSSSDSHESEMHCRGLANTFLEMRKHFHSSDPFFSSMLPLVDYIVVNDGSLEDLRRKVKAVSEDLQKKLQSFLRIDAI